MFPEVIRAGAGPHDLGSGDNEGETFPELTAGTDSEPTTSDAGDLGGQPIDDADAEPDVVVRNMPLVWLRHAPSFLF